MASISMRISLETKKKLDELRHHGQSYDGIIKELIEKVEERGKKAFPVWPNKGRS